MNRSFNYGHLLTDDEYDRQIIDINSNLPEEPTRAQYREVRRKELNLAIDHRLGRDFPQLRREALWNIQQRIERKRVWFIAKYFFRRLFAKKIARDAQNLAGYLVQEYAKVLNKEELECFFGAEEVRNPSLPINLNQLKK